MALAGAVCTLQQRVILPHEDTCCAGSATHVNGDPEWAQSRATHNEIAMGASKVVAHAIQPVLVKTMVLAAKADRAHKTCVMVPLGRAAMQSLTRRWRSTWTIGRTSYVKPVCHNAWDWKIEFRSSS
eukprot:99580-Amphidinium_carterae.1